MSMHNRKSDSVLNGYHNILSSRSIFYTNIPKTLYTVTMPQAHHGKTAQCTVWSICFAGVSMCCSVRTLFRAGHTCVTWGPS